MKKTILHITAEMDISDIPDKFIKYEQENVIKALDQFIRLRRLVTKIITQEEEEK